MARPAKKPPDQWKSEILDAALTLFLSKGYQETSVADIMIAAGGSKGLFYRFFQSKEDVANALGYKLFSDNNPFDAVKARTDLNGLQKLRELIRINQSNATVERFNTETLPILKDSRILAAAIEENRRILTPLWFELLEEARQDGSIETEYTRELSELLPLVNFWLIPSVFPATAEEIRHKFQFIMVMFARMGLPLMDEEQLSEQTDKFLCAVLKDKKD